MANNFRLTGNYYVSKAGNDAWDGLTKDTPKATINAVLSIIANTAQTVIIGAGVYEENISKTVSNSTIFRADGNVKIRGNGANVMTLTSSTSLSLYDITFENYATFTITGAATVVRCSFLNLPSITTTSFTGLANCIFINCTCTSTSAFQGSYSIFINCYVYFGPNCTNNYFNSASTYRLNADNNHNYNNVMCPIYRSNQYFPDLASQKAAYPVVNANSFNLPPKFNNVYKYDFTLQYDSPHIGAASDGANNIGGTNYAKVSDMYTSPEWQIINGALYSKNNGTDLALNAAEADIIYSGQDLVLAAGKTKGYVIPAPVKVAANPQVLQAVNLNGIGYFNKSAANGGLMNDNVPDADAYPASNTPVGAAGASPDRLSYGFRFTDNDTQPGSDVDWLNGYNGTAGEFVLLEPFGKPLMNSNGIGSGSPLFDPAVGIELSVIWVQPKITLTRQYA